MHKLLSAVAVSALMAGAALASPLSTGDAERILQIVPDADLSMITDEQAALLSTFVNQDDGSRSQSDVDYVRSVLAGTVIVPPEAPAELSAGDRERVLNLIPGVEEDLAKLNEEQAQMLARFVNSAQYSQTPAAENYIRAVLSGELSMTPEAPGMLSTSDAERVRMLLPDADLSGLTEAQVADLSTFVNGDDYGRSASDVEYLRSVLNS